jgi:hypothetical protein
MTWQRDAITGMRQTSGDYTITRRSSRLGVEWKLDYKGQRIADTTTCAEAKNLALEHSKKTHDQTENDRRTLG